MPMEESQVLITGVDMGGGGGDFAVLNQSSLTGVGHPRKLAKRRWVRRQRMDLLATGPLDLSYWHPFTTCSYQLEEQDLLYSLLFFSWKN